MSEIIEKTFTVASPARLDLRNIRGSVEIRPGGESILQIQVTKDENSGDANRTAIELSQEMDGGVKAATHFPEGAWSWLFGSFPCRVDYVVQTPRKCSSRSMESAAIYAQKDSKANSPSIQSAVR